MDQCTHEVRAEYWKGMYGSQTETRNEVISFAVLRAKIRGQAKGEWYHILSFLFLCHGKLLL